MHFWVPPSVNVDFFFAYKKRMTSSSFSRNFVVWNDLLPIFCLKIKSVKVIKCNSLVIESTMTSKKPNFVLIDTCRRIRSGWWSINAWSLVLSVIMVSNTFPLVFLDKIVPSIIKSCLRTVMTSKDENFFHSLLFIIFVDTQSNVLRSSKRFDIPWWAFLSPLAII